MGRRQATKQRLRQGMSDLCHLVSISAIDRSEEERDACRVDQDSIPVRERNDAMDAHASSVSKERLQLENRGVQ